MLHAMYGNMVQRLTSIVALSALASFSCSSQNVSEMPGEIVQSELGRDLQPDVPDSDMQALVAGNSAFALDLYHTLGAESEGENLFISPLSISTAIAMVHAGARENTEAQIADALHFSLGQDQLHPAFNSLDLQLASRGNGASGSDDGAFRLNVVNGTFGQLGFEFLPAFLDRLALNYGAGLSLLDFLNDPEASREVINDWVADVTEDNILDLLPQGSISSNTKLVLANAVYFNAAWKTKFDPDRTISGVFHTLSQDVTVDMMTNEMDSLAYASGDGFEAFSLPYDGDELDMVFIVPEVGDFANIHSALTPQWLATVLGSLAPGEIGGVTLPKFDFRFRSDLVGAMKSLGMTDAFGPSSDFSGIDGTRNLTISGIVHEAFVKVTEDGTEAGGATAVIVGDTSVPQWVTVDRPFVFLVRDIETGTILFLGRVMDPS